MSTISLAVLVLQCFIGVEASLNRYQKLDSIARDLKRRILIYKATFQLGIEHHLLRGGARGGGFLQFAGKGGGVIKTIWNDHLLERDIGAKLGQHHGLVRNSIQGARVAVEGIAEILEELAMETKGKDRALGILRPAVAESRIVSIFRACSLNLLAMLLPGGWVQPSVESEKPVLKNLGLRGSPQMPELRELLAELQKNIASLSEVLQLACKPAQSSSNTSQTSAISGTPTSVLARNPEKFKSSCFVLDRLYDILSRELDCRCHFIHLCLCSVSVGHSDSMSSLQPPMGPGSICSLFVTLNLKTLRDRYDAEDPLHLTVLGFESSDIDPASSTPTLTQSQTRCSPCCSEIVTSPIGSSHHLVHPDSTQTEFLLRSTSLPAYSPNTDTFPNPPNLQPIVTLHELLESHSQWGSSVKLVERDRFLLAAKLAQWVLQHYGTSWLRDLDAHDIRFFTRYEPNLAQNYANWTPYISTTFNGLSNRHRQHNKELYDLGVVLLQLGLKEPLIYDLGNKVDVVRASSRKLLTSLGRRYRDVVEKLLLEGERGDLVEEKIINELENGIGFIKEMALEYFPE